MNRRQNSSQPGYRAHMNRDGPIYGGKFVNTKLNARLALRQRADLLVANIWTDRISLPQGQSYTEGKYSNGSLN